MGLLADAARAAVEAAGLTEPVPGEDLFLLQYERCVARMLSDRVCSLIARSAMIDNHKYRTHEKPALASSPTRKILLNRWRALAIVTLAYGSAAWSAGVLFRFVESIQGIDDARDEQAAALFAAIMGVCWLISVPLVLLRR